MITPNTVLIRSLLDWLDDASGDYCTPKDLREIIETSLGFSRPTGAPARIREQAAKYAIGSELAHDAVDCLTRSSQSTLTTAIGGLVAAAVKGVISEQANQASNIQVEFQLGGIALSGWANMLEAAQKAFDQGRSQLDSVLAELPALEKTHGGQARTSLMLAWQRTESGLNSLYGAAQRMGQAVEEVSSALDSIKYSLGEPKVPELRHEDDFVYNSATGSFEDWKSMQNWKTKLLGAEYLRPDLDDATAMYRHYWDNNGEKLKFDYDEAYREDSGIRKSVDSEIGRAVAAADSIARTGRAGFKLTGESRAVDGTYYPATENWQKTVGAHRIWSHADVRVEGNRVTMKVTVEAQDYYDFNRKDADIATGIPDSENGRFTEIGWAKPFETYGTLTRTVSWELGHPTASVTEDSSAPSWNPGREDHLDHKNNGGDNGIAANDRSTGQPQPR